MKEKRNIFIGILVAALVLFAIGCEIPGTDGDGSDGEIAVTFESAVQTGGTDGTADSTSLTLTFSADPDTLAASDITLTGATKGTLSGTGTTRTLAISAITVGNGETLSIEIADPSGYTISGSPQTAVVYRDVTYELGDTGPSGVGIVFYITDGGLHGMEIAPEDQGSSVAWSNIDNAFVNGVDSLPADIGTGASNTDAIIAQTGHTASAAQLCHDYAGGGLTDWYLPSENELLELYKISMGDPAENEHISNIPELDYRNLGISVWYWTSTESSSDSAERLQFEWSGSGSNLKWKTVSMKVRAVRSF